LIGKDGEVVADCAGQGSLPRAQFVELAVGIRDTADDASRRMDTGALVRAEIEGPGGNVTVCRVRGTTFAVFFGEPMRGERMSELVSDFVTKSMAAAREPVRA
jgi:hypothetical protein